MTTMREWVDKYSDENVQDDESNGLLVMDGFDDCIVGVARRFNDTFVVYDQKKVIEKLMQDGMTYDEAFEFWEFNQVGGWHGSPTPAFFVTMETEDLDGVQSDERE